MCPERESNPHSHKPRDFKSLVSTNSTIWASHTVNAICRFGEVLDVWNPSNHCFGMHGIRIFL